MAGDKARLSSLDTLRGVAIVMVVAFHVSLHFQLHPGVMTVLNFGNQGVQLFFLISAFTMCLMWEDRVSEPQRTAKFYIRRAMRIAPLYWLAIAVYCAFDHLAGRPPSTAYQMAMNATFLHGFSPDAINSAVPGGWSIAVEMSFYAVFPLLAVLSRRPVALMGFAVASYVLLGVLASPWLQAHYELPAIFLYYSQLTQFPIFPLGMAVYALVVRPDAAAARGAAALAAAWLVIAFAGKYGLGLNTRPFFWVQNFAFAVAVIGCVRQRLSVPVFAVLGTLSYSMYLFHFLAVYAVARLMPADWSAHGLAFIGAFVVVLAVTALVGRLSRDTLERWSATAARAMVAALGRTNARPAVARSSDPS